MSKAFLKKHMPDPDKLIHHKNLQFLGERLHEPNLWHLNRRSIATAFAVGLFCAWIPSPTQMAMAAAGAFYFKGNLPIAVALVWLTNPITMPPLFYFAYLIGLLLLNRASPSADFEFSVDGVLSGIGDIWQPFLAGCLFLGVACSWGGYLGVNYYWHYHVTQKWAERKQRRAAAQAPSNAVTEKGDA